MTSPLIALLLASCQWFAPELPPASPTLPASTFHTVGGAPVYYLADHLDEATVKLPQSNRPADAGELGVFTLDAGWKKVDDERDAWSIPSPVALPAPRNHVAPRGLTMLQGESSLPYRCPPRGPRARWCAQDDQLIVSGERSPATLSPPLTLVAEGAIRLQQRLDVAASGLSAAEYMAYEHTLPMGKARITRPGLLLPAPAEAAWTLTLPQGARLDLAATLVDLGMQAANISDGVRLDVLVNEELVSSEVVRSPERYDQHRVDLSRWSGQAVTLTLRSRPRDSSDWDYLFLGEPVVTGDSEGEVRRVVVIGLDTTRWANFTQSGHVRDTTSALQPLAESSALFDDAFTPAPRTRPSFRTATTGRRPLDAIDATTIGEVMRAQGFLTAGVTANVHLVPRFGFNDGYGLWYYENAVDADVEIQRAKAWLREVKDRDAFLFMHLMDPHTFYNAPLFYENKFVTGDPGDLEWYDNRWQVTQMIPRLNDSNKLWMQERYDGELNYMADQLAGFVAWVSSLPGQTLIVIHSDHGEEFFEHGGYEHNHTLYQEVVKAVLWVRPPGGWGEGPHHLTDKVALMDIAPTLYDFIGLPEADWPEVDGVSLRALLDAGLADDAPALRERLAARPIPIGHLMYDKERWAVVADGHKYIVQTMSGREELYDLRADPGEQKNLATEADRATIDPFLAALSEATGWPAGPGLRVEIEGGGQPFTLRFEAPVEALVLDPEAGKERRANLEWGEASLVSPEDVGTLSFSEDKLELTFTPGASGRGTLAVVTGRWDTAATVVVGAEEAPLDVDGERMKVDRVRLFASAGAVVLPLDSVREHLIMEGEEDWDSMSALQSLGYVDDHDDKPKARRPDRDEADEDAPDEDAPGEGSQ